MGTPYTNEWRDRVRAGAQASAAVIVPMLADLVHTDEPLTVVDVGAGEGWFSAEFDELGAETTLVDGPWVEDVANKVDFDRPPYPDLGRHDLALCLEVAEHVPARCADDLVGWLCQLAPVVAFSAAIPGQGGVGHVNEQPPAYWVDLFHQHDYEGTGVLRPGLWTNTDVEPWYAQNVLIFAEDLAAIGLEADGCPYIVHPGIWAAYR